MSVSNLQNPVLLIPKSYSYNIKTQYIIGTAQSISFKNIYIVTNENLKPKNPVLLTIVDYLKIDQDKKISIFNEISHIKRKINKCDSRTKECLALLLILENKNYTIDIHETNNHIHESSKRLLGKKGIMDNLTLQTLIKRLYGLNTPDFTKLEKKAFKEFGYKPKPRSEPKLQLTHDVVKSVLDFKKACDSDSDNE